MKRSLYNYIEKRAKDIKGEDFNTRKLIYEMDGFIKMYTGWEMNNPKPIANIKNMTIIQIFGKIFIISRKILFPFMNP